VTRPLVSVLTPTWKRPRLLLGAIENVRSQTYRPLEHVIVSDGPDPATSRVAVAALDCADTADVLVRYVPLGRNWSAYLHDSFCAAPITVAMLLAGGEYQVWLADDERMAPDHIESLVDALEAACPERSRGGADFAYSKVEMRWYDNRTAPWVIGTDPPRLGGITNCLYRADLLKRGLFPFGAGMTADWACISQWQSRGAVHAFVDRVTLTHVVDH